MSMKMSKVKECNAQECAYNRDDKCHAIAITIGDGTNPFCDTSFKSSSKGGVLDMTAGVGACKVSSCKFNESLECGSPSIEVRQHSSYAECDTFMES